MSIQRPRSARELVLLAGRPTAAAAVGLLSLAFAPAVVLGQSGAQPALRDPTKPSQDGGEPKVVVSEHGTVDLHVKDDDLANVLELLSIQSQKNIIASKNVSAKVTATLYGVTFYQALDAILHVNGFGYLEKGNFIYVYTNEELKQIEAALKKRVSKAIRLDYLNAVDAKEFVTPLLSKDGGEVKANAATKEFTISDKAPVGKNDYALSDTLVIFDYEENIAAIEELIRQIDTRPAQVLVESTILQTSLNEDNAFGVDFSIIGDINFTDFLNIGGPLGAANGLIKGGSGAAGQGFSPPDNQGNAIVSNPGNTSGPGTFKVGIVGGDVSIFIRMLDQVTDTVILSNPKILALNRQPARVLVGKRVGYLQTTSTETSTTQTVEFLDTGTQLYFRPFVSSDGEIRMELKPQVSAAEIRTVTDANGAAVTIPDEVTQELVTNVNVRDGQTIVLGGLFTENQSFTRRQVPFLGDIPLVGAAFRGNEDSTDRSEIIFLITPSIVTDTSIAAAAERAGADIERIRAGSRQGLLFFSREKMTAQLNVEAERAAREGDYDLAMWKIQRSLSLNANQPEAYRLRERITGEREHWSDPSMLNEILEKEVTDRLHQVNPASTPPKHKAPWGSVKVPREKTTPTEAAPAGASVPAQDTAPQAANSGPETAGPEPMTSDASSSLGFTTNSFESALTDAFSNRDRGLSAPVENGGVAEAETPAIDPAAPLTTELTADAKAVQTLLPSLNGQIDIYEIMNGDAKPNLGMGESSGWQDLIDSQLLSAPPVNAWVGGANAARVVVGNAPDAAFHGGYGWIYNPQTGDLWAAGFDADNNPLPKPATAKAPVQPSTSPAPNNAATTAMDDGAWEAWLGFSPRKLLDAMKTSTLADRDRAAGKALQTTGVPSEPGDSNK